MRRRELWCAQDCIWNETQCVQVTWHTVVPFNSSLQPRPVAYPKSCFSGSQFWLGHCDMACSVDGSLSELLAQVASEEAHYEAE